MKLLTILLLAGPTTALWEPLGAFIVPDSSLTQNFGKSVALSNDGLTLASSSQESVSVYQYQDNDWQKTWQVDQESSFISLNPNGTHLAVRYINGTVQVYEQGQPLGSALHDCPGGELQLTEEYLVMGCDRLGYGEVHIYIFDADWMIMTTLKGTSPGDRFGWSVSMDATYVAVSSPNFDQKRGKVQLYNISDSTTHTLIHEWTGDAEGVQFGFSVALSLPYTAVGIPSNPGGGDRRGSVAIYTFLNKTAEFHGPNDGDRLGRAVALSENRLAASTFRYDSFRGLVHIYERLDNDTFGFYEALAGQDTLERFGSDVGLSRSGSVLISGATNWRNENGDSVGSVRVFIDKTPFCSVPTSVNTDPFLLREECRDGGMKLNDTMACQMQTSFFEGAYFPCVWQDGVNDKQSPSHAPTIFPTQNPSLTPTALPFASATLEGCVCDENNNCISEPLAQGASLGLCIAGRRSDIELIGVGSLQLEQGSSKMTIIDRLGSRLSGANATCSGQLCRIQTPVDTIFFQSESGNLTASGTIVIGYPNHRYLRAGRLQQVPSQSEGEFNVDVALSKTQEYANEGHLGFPVKFWLMLLALIILVICCSCGLLRLRPKAKRASLKNKPNAQTPETSI